MTRYNKLVSNRAALVAESKAFYATETELTAEEITRDDAIAEEIKALDFDIARAKRQIDYEATAPAASRPQGTYEKIEIEEPTGFANSGQFAKAIYLKATNQYTDPRLNASVSGMNTLTPSEGGLAVPETVSTDLLNSIMDDPTNLMSRCNQINNVKGELRLIVGDDSDRSGGLVYGGVKVYRVKEGEQLTSSKPGLRSVSFTPHAIHGMVYVTDELMSQGDGALEQYINKSVTAAFAYAHNNEIIRGSGTGGQFNGILNSKSLITVVKEPGQDADTIVSENIAKMTPRLRPQFRGNSIWLANQDCETQLRQMVIGVGTGGAPVFLPSGGYSEAMFGALDGREIVYTEHSSALGDLGDIMFVDLSQYMVVTGGPAVAASSMHIRFDYAETALRWTMYSDGKFLNDSVYKPSHGSNMSAAVALAARA